MTDRFNVVQARLNAGLTQRQLSIQTGVPYASVQRLEAGLGLRPANAKRIADFFGVRVTDLLPVGPGPSESSAAA